ncbi:YmfQ family protein [Desulfosporosinus sp. Sb-LF]|uniref:YmfQ family protein n=1 Tax=Desulfosporosinus sp. Sb-LF TaxID=2560027 RepID=UPI00107F3F1F|nr:YmfQ family protein [Desulfosporosinus sp. Sb-LF]TGE33314.1 DUF2313 domain-containing protein [Desulfosporosinus sp. Sb-LF]
MYSEDYYGVLLYSQPEPEPDGSVVESLTPDLMAYLPAYLNASRTMTELQAVEAGEIGLINARRADLLNQCFIDTATWALVLWESELGIETDLSKPYEDRRQAVKAKRRGSGTVTKQMIITTVLSYTNADVQIIENPAVYTFTLKFVGIMGIPPNMANLVKTLDDIKPAHLSYTFEYSYSWWDKIAGLTWSSCSTGTWDALKVY